MASFATRAGQERKSNMECGSSTNVYVSRCTFECLLVFTDQLEDCDGTVLLWCNLSEGGRKEVIILVQPKAG